MMMQGLAQVVDNADLSDTATGTSSDQPPGLARISSHMLASGGSAKRRGGEAAANLAGMQRLLDQAVGGSSDGGQGHASRVLTRAPAFDAQLHTCRRTASSQIQPPRRSGSGKLCPAQSRALGTCALNASVMWGGQCMTLQAAHGSENLESFWDR